MMMIYFTPTPASKPPMPAYRSAELTCEAEGEYDVSDELAKQLCADFPDNFTAVGDEKSAGKPSHNRAAARPGKDR